ncbi:MAG: hypothetical protein RIR51_766 [Bacteroidota bacterium]|jgi:F-type H+-transporting ATPase subunit epsilon
MNVEIITPDRNVFSGEAKVVTLPGTDGSFQILNEHTPLVGSLVSGKMEVDSQSYMIEGGVVEVLKNKVLILLEGITEN